MSFSSSFFHAGLIWYTCLVASIKEQAARMVCDGCHLSLCRGNREAMQGARCTQRAAMDGGNITSCHWKPVT